MARDLKLERAWRERMRQFEKSGLTIRRFCEQEGLVDHQFSWWRRELKRRAAKSAPRKQMTKTRSRVTRVTQQPKAPIASFVPVQVESSSPAQSSVEIVLDQPPRIRVTAGFDAELLRQVVRVLEQS
jgi:hypothetical protein